MHLPRHTALLGGSFNPPHIGHFRLALEVMEALRPASLMFIPCSNPPHKPSGNLLPFELRCQMLQASLEQASFPLSSCTVSRIEQERTEPSYTVETLKVLRNQGHEKLLFIMGEEDLPSLPSWHAWHELSGLTDFAVLPRVCKGKNDVVALVKHVWPKALYTDTSGSISFSLPGGSFLWYCTQPVLEISSSIIRNRWLNGRSLDFLVPNAVIRTLYDHAALVKKIWNVDVSHIPLRRDTLSKTE